MMRGERGRSHHLRAFSHSSDRRDCDGKASLAEMMGNALGRTFVTFPSLQLMEHRLAGRHTVHQELLLGDSYMACSASSYSVHLCLLFALFTEPLLATRWTAVHVY